MIKYAYLNQPVPERMHDILAERACVYRAILHSTPKTIISSACNTYSNYNNYSNYILFTPCFTGLIMRTCKGRSQRTMSNNMQAYNVGQSCSDVTIIAIDIKIAIFKENLIESIWRFFGARMTRFL